MDELEHKLRSALTEMAEEVPASHHAWAEHQRRIASRKTRRPFLMAAVAAAVVALIAVPVAVLQIRTDKVDTAGIPESSQPPSVSTTSSNEPSTRFTTPPEGVYQPEAGETVLTQPVVVQYEGPDSDATRTLAYTTQRDDKRYLCLVTVKGEQRPVINGPRASACGPMNPPRTGKYVWTSRLVTSSSQSGQMLYVASEPTDNILVRRAEGPYASSYRVAQADGFALFVVVLGSNNPPAAYTARDKANATLENG